MCLTPEMFKERYKEIYKGDDNWKSISNSRNTYDWNDTTYKISSFLDAQNKFELKILKTQEYWPY